MDSLLIYFKELINPMAIQKPTPDHRTAQWIYTLREEQCADSQIELVGVPEESLVFNLDDFYPAPLRIFTEETRRVCSRADYVIIAPDCQDDKSYHIVFIEMKRDRDSEGVEHISAQLRGARCFIDYCVSLIRHFWQCELDDIVEDNCRYVACLKTAFEVHGRPDNCEPPHKDVDAPLRLEGKRRFHYNQLIGRKPR